LISLTDRHSLEHSDYVSDEMCGATPKPPMERLRDMTGVMVMKKGCTVAGRVLDVQGKPIQWATVAQGADRFGSDYPSTQTDGEGRFEFRHARLGQMVLTVQAGGQAPDLRQILVREGAGPVEFRLEAGHTLKGRVVDKETGQPIPEFTLVPGFDSGDNWPAYWERRQARPLTGGRYEIAFGEPRPGHLVRMEAEAYLPEVSRAFDDGESQATFDFTLRRGAGLSGTVCFPDGKPVAGAQVILSTSTQGVLLRNGRQDRVRSAAARRGPQRRCASGPAATPPGRRGRMDSFPFRPRPIHLFSSCSTTRAMCKCRTTS